MRKIAKCLICKLEKERNVYVLSTWRDGYQVLPACGVFLLIYSLFLFLNSQILFPKFSKYCSQILKLGAKLLHFCELCKFLSDFFRKKFSCAESSAEGLIIYFKLTVGYVTTSRPQVHI